MISIGKASKFVEGNDWQRDCPGVRELQELLRVAPKENAAWDFL